MAVIQLNINRLGQGWFILWEEAVLGGSLGVYQAAEVPGGWMEGWMDEWRDGWVQNRTCGLMSGTTGTTLPPARFFRATPLIEIQENEVKTGGLGLLGRCERYSRCSHSRKQPEPNHRKQCVPPLPLSCGRITVKTPSFAPGSLRHYWLLSNPPPGLRKQGSFPPGCHSQQLHGQSSLPCDNDGCVGPSPDGFRQLQARRDLTEGLPANHSVDAPAWPLGAGGSGGWRWPYTAGRRTKAAELAAMSWQCLQKVWQWAHLKLV